MIELDNYNNLISQNAANKKCDSLENDNDIEIDSMKLYLREISKYPLLTDEQIKKYSTLLKSSNDSKLLLVKNVSNYNAHVLNIPLLFNSLAHTSTYNDIIDTLLKFYGRLNSGDKVVEDKLLKYKSISKKLGRPLSNDELQQYFNITCDDYLEKKELLSEVKKFMLYKYAFDKMFVSNLRLVVNVAKKYHYNTDLFDAITEGNIGLMKAIDMYNPSLGYCFSTYATWWIRHKINRGIIRNNFIRLPDNIYSTIVKYKRNVANLEKEMGRSLSDDEISEKLNIPIETVNEYNCYMFEIISLSQPINDDSKATILDMISNEEDYNKSDLNDELKNDITLIFQYLNKREVEVLKMCFGLCEYSGKALSIPEIAKKLSVSAKRVRQIEYGALCKLRTFARYEDKIKSLKIYL